MISLHEAKEYKKFVFIENGIGPFVSNIFINGTITYFVFKNVMEGSLPKQSILIDLISTGFLLPFITVYLAKLVIKKQVDKGKLKPISKTGLIQNAIFKLPISVFAILISIFCLAFFTLPILTFSIHKIHGLCVFQRNLVWYYRTFSCTNNWMLDLSQSFCQFS